MVPKKWCHVININNDIASRYAVGGSRSTVKDVSPNSVTEFKNPNAFWTQASAPFPIGILFGMKEVIVQNASVDFNGNGFQRGIQLVP